MKRAPAVTAAIVLVVAAGMITTACASWKPTTRAQLQLSMREAWSAHAWYTREYYVSAIQGSANQQAAAQRLLKNQEDIGALFGIYYGTATRAQTTTLLKEHIAIAVEVVAAAKAGDQTKLAQANERWHRNFVELATLLHRINLNHFPYDRTLKMLNDHLALLTAAVTSFLAGDFPRSVIDNDAYVSEILTMADHFSQGIIAQFPDKFRR